MSDYVQKGRIQKIKAGTGITLDPTSGEDGEITIAASGGEAFPIGSVFIGVVSTDPATLLGYGTWSAFGAGKVLVGLNAGDTDFDTAEETGGAKTVASTGTVSQPTFSGSALGTHSHGIGTYAAANESSHTHSVTSNVGVSDHSAHTHNVTATGTVAWPVGVPTNAAHTHDNHTSASTKDASSGSATSKLTGPTTHSSVAPVISWPAGVPTFSGSAATSTNPSITLSHGVTNNAVTSGAGSAHTHTLSGSSEAVSAGTPAGSVSQPTYTGNSTSVVQPYIVVYMWKRTA